MAFSCFPSQFSRLIQQSSWFKKSDNIRRDGSNATVLPQEKLSTQREISTSPPADVTAWQQLDSKYRETLDEHGYYWWQTSGYALAALLCNAGYTKIAQVQSLEFFAQDIATRLGVANRPGVERWKSFMTDDHNPIELSWDWHTGHKAPQIRFSIEPVGLLAGSAQDSRNELMSAEFAQVMKKDQPAASLLWFEFFESYFSFGKQHKSSEGHQSSVFWAFDLGEKDIIGKVYFFPGYRAAATGRTNLQVMSEAIESAPHSKPEDLVALYMFQEFAQEYLEATSSPLEMDMLAIDILEPSKSRLKIYFRTRETSFEWVRKAMTLGGRVQNGDMDVGLQNLRQLWDRLFGQQGMAEGTPLPTTDHRTAGILFNIEFRLGSKAPKVKIYIPVRHYAQNDWQIIMAVSDYMTSATKIPSGPTSLAQGPNPSSYGDTMISIL